jgi:hypothetical protein
MTDESSGTKGTGQGIRWKIPSLNGQELGHLGLVDAQARRYFNLLPGVGRTMEARIAHLWCVVDLLDQQVTEPTSDRLHGADGRLGCGTVLSNRQTSEAGQDVGSLVSTTEASVLS